MANEIYGFTVDTLAGTPVSLDAYRGKVLLIVNTASKCGLTPQYEGLESLYKQFNDQGLEILGFPCNQFGKQEPGSHDEIQTFCQMNYGVSFPMFAKIDVNGDNTNPLYQYLKKSAPGILGTQKIKWNFTKFLIGKDGDVIHRFAPATKPAAIEKAIVSALKA